MEGETPRRPARKALLELPDMLVVSFALVFGFVRPVIAAPFYVGSESMVPTLEVWDRVPDHRPNRCAATHLELTVRLCAEE